MDTPADYRAINRATWDERAPAHAASPGYALDRFRADPRFLSDVVRFDLARLGDVDGLRGVHLQCHIGTDTISLARLGARMTGLDFSPTALVEARALAVAVGAEVDFVEADLYGAPAVLPAGAFDLVFTGIGALCWLPDVRRWWWRSCWRRAGDCSCARGTRCSGRSTSVSSTGWRSGSPTSRRRTPWSGTSRAPTSPPTWPSPTPSRTAGTTASGRSSPLLDHGLTLTRLVEHDSVPWEALPGQMRVLGNGEWRLADRPERLPHSYTLQAVKTG